MKLYYLKQETKRFQFLGVMLAEYLNMKLNPVTEEEILKIVKPDDMVYYSDNAMSRVELSNKCRILGPSTRLANKWNDKTYQANELKDIITIPEYKSYRSVLEIIKDINFIKSAYKKFIIFENISDGGKRCHVGNEETIPSDFFSHFVKSPPGFRVSKFIDNIHNISLHFVIADKNKFWISPIIDQRIEDEVKFRGGIYPSTISDNIESKVIEETSKVAEVLSKDGYVGLCHIDFMIADDIVYFAEINPRKAGTTMCKSYMMENCFNYSIPMIEYHAIIEKRIIDIKRIKKDIPWSVKFIPYTDTPKDNPGDERELFKSNNKGTVEFSECFKTHSFKVETYDSTK